MRIPCSWKGLESFIFTSLHSGSLGDREERRTGTRVWVPLQPSLPHSLSPLTTPSSAPNKIACSYQNASLFCYRSVISFAVFIPPLLSLCYYRFHRSQSLLQLYPQAVLTGRRRKPCFISLHVQLAYKSSPNVRWPLCAGYAKKNHSIFRIFKRSFPNISSSGPLNCFSKAAGRVSLGIL